MGDSVLYAVSPGGLEIYPTRCQARAALLHQHSQPQHSQPYTGEGGTLGKHMVRIPYLANPLTAEN